MRILPILLSLALFTGCAFRPTAPIAKAAQAGITSARASVQATRQSVTKATAGARMAQISVAEAERAVEAIPDDALHPNGDLAKAKLSLRQAAGQIDELTAQLVEATFSGNAAESELANSQAKVEELAKHDAGETARADHEHDRSEKLAVDLAYITTRYHRIKVPLCSLGAAVVGFGAFKFLGFLFPPWGAVAAVALGLGMFGALFAFL